VRGGSEDSISQNDGTLDLRGCLWRCSSSLLDWIKIKERKRTDLRYMNISQIKNSYATELIPIYFPIQVCDYVFLLCLKTENFLIKIDPYSGLVFAV
jgi:hypothetical protein